MIHPPKELPAEYMSDAEARRYLDNWMTEINERDASGCPRWLMELVRIIQNYQREGSKHKRGGRRHTVQPSVLQEAFTTIPGYVKHRSEACRLIARKYRISAETVRKYTKHMVWKVNKTKASSTLGCITR